MANLMVWAIPANPQAGPQRQSIATAPGYPVPDTAPTPPPRGPDLSEIVAPRPQDQPIGPPPAFAANILEAQQRERLHPRPVAAPQAAALVATTPWSAEAPSFPGRTIDRQL